MTKKEQIEALKNEIIEKVLDNLSYNKEDGEYHENYENWMLSLSKKDYELLKASLNN